MKILIQLNLIILILSEALFTACSHSETDRGSYSKSETLIHPLEKSPPDGWEVIDNEGADFALVSETTGSLFVINTACKKGKNVNLENLANSLLAGIDQLTITTSQIINFQNKDAKLIEAQGSLDGVKRFLKIMTISHNFCVYDFSLISINHENYQRDSMEFDKFLQTIKIN